MKLNLKLYYPLNTLKPIGQEIWLVDGGLVEMDMKLISLPFTTRMTVVRLPGQKLWLHSPIAPEPKLLEELGQLGQVAYLIAPNKIHYAYINAWKDLYPEAEVWLAPGIVERAKSQKIALPEGQALTDLPVSAWRSDLRHHLFKGSRFMEEAVFYHRPSKTLILTDMIENIRTDQMGFWSRQLFKLGDNAAPCGCTPRDLRQTFLGRHDLARQSYDLIKSWRPEQIVLAHGDCFWENAQLELERSFTWLQ